MNIFTFSHYLIYNCHWMAFRIWDWMDRVCVCMWERGREFSPSPASPTRRLKRYGKGKRTKKEGKNDFPSFFHRYTFNSELLWKSNICYMEEKLYSYICVMSLYTFYLYKSISSAATKFATFLFHVGGWCCCCCCLSRPQCLLLFAMRSQHHVYRNIRDARKWHIWELLSTEEKNGKEKLFGVPFIQSMYSNKCWMCFYGYLRTLDMGWEFIYVFCRGGFCVLC